MGTIIVYDYIGNILFNPGCTYSYVLVNFALGFNAICDVLDTPIYVSTPIGEFVIVIHVYRACSVLFMGFKTWASLVIMDMTNFYVILGIVTPLIHPT